MFVDSLTSFPSQKAERYNIIKEIQHQLEAHQQQVTDQDVEVKFEISKWEAPRVLSFSLKSKNLNGSVDFDVLPAFNALGEAPHTFAPRGGRVWNDGGRGVERKPRGSGMGHGARALTGGIRNGSNTLDK